MSSRVEEILNDHYTLADAALAADVSPVTIWRWLKAGRLQGHRIGREVLIEKAPVEALRRSAKRMKGEDSGGAARGEHGR